MFIHMYELIVDYYYYSMIRAYAFPSLAIILLSELGNIMTGMTTD